MLSMSPWSKTFLLKAVLAMFLFVYVGLAFLGGINLNGQTGNCPFMPGHSAAICQSNPLEHIQELQSMFTSIPSSSNFLLALLTLLFSVIVVGFFLKNLLTPLLSVIRFKVGLYPSFALRSVLQEAYSQGVLNSRAF